LISDGPYWTYALNFAPQTFFTLFGTKRDFIVYWFTLLLSLR